MRISSRLNLVVLLLLLVAMVVPGSLVMAQGDEGGEEEVEFNIEFEFTGTIVSIDDDGIVVDVEGELFYLAPSGAFNPSQFEEGDEVQFNGLLLNDDTIKVTELELVEDEEGECAEGEVLEEGECVPAEETECAEGEVLEEGECVPAEEVECAEGEVLVEGECVAEEEEGEEEESEGPAACQRDDHPVVTALSEEFEVDYEVVAGYFCDGYGLGNIARAMMVADMTGMDVEELLAMENRGKAWKEILDEAELSPSDLAPGRSVSANKNKNKAEDAEAPGNSGNASGRNREEGDAPGNSGNAHGNSGNNGNSGNAPGQQKKNK